jgi:hypothetical protein
MRDTTLRGEKLIFLISQPRAGSTLLQRILAGHPEIHTASEPWLMLHPLYALRCDGFAAEYDARLASSALHSFLRTLPGTEEDYHQGVRQMALHLYDRALEGSGRQYFLDKTPRYYLVIPELYRTFPQAHYLFLLRNPLAVLCSIAATWIQEEWLGLYDYRHDLLRAPDLLLQGIELLGESGLVVRYEGLVANPIAEIQRICKWLGIPLLPDMIEYGSRPQAHWPFGDQTAVYQRRRPDAENLQKWIDSLHDAQVWRVANDYLQWLGPERVQALGYSYQDLHRLLKAHQPHRLLLCATASLPRLLKRPPAQQAPWLRAIVRLRKWVRQQGLWWKGIRAQSVAR